MQHPIAECWVLRKLVHYRFKEGTLELSQSKVQRNPLPNHKEKGVIVVMVYANPGEEKEESPALLAVAITIL